MVAMIYATNSKASCFTGFNQIIDPKKVFRYDFFLAAHALPGPQSFITCIFQQHGAENHTRFLTIEKKSAFSQVPGLKYESYVLANVPRPSTWLNTEMSEYQRQAVKFNPIANTFFESDCTAARHYIMLANVFASLTQCFYNAGDDEYIALDDLMQCFAHLTYYDDSNLYDDCVANTPLAKIKLLDYVSLSN